MFRQHVFFCRIFRLFLGKLDAFLLASHLSKEEWAVFNKINLQAKTLNSRVKNYTHIQESKILYEKTLCISLQQRRQSKFCYYSFLWIVFSYSVSTDTKYLHIGNKTGKLSVWTFNSWLDYTRKPVIFSTSCYMAQHACFNFFQQIVKGLLSK